MPTEPEEIKVGSVSYLRDGNLCAASLGDAREAPSRALWVTEAPRLAVIHASDVEDLPRFGPVYRAEPAGTLAVPTGRVFVRFEQGLGAPERARILRDSGYRVEDMPSWAPGSAWIVPAEGGVAEALHGISELCAHAGVIHVEPELLRPKTKRTSRS
jgi:hypothetical protein